MDDNKLVLLKNNEELSEEEKNLKDALMNIDKKYNSTFKVINEIYKENKDSFLIDESVQELTLTIYLTAVVKIISNYMDVESKEFIDE